MLRRLHSLPGLIFGLALLLMASSGAILSLAPVLDRMQAPVAAGQTVAEVAARAYAENPGLSKHRGSLSCSVRAGLLDLTQHFNRSLQLRNERFKYFDRIAG